MRPEKLPYAIDRYTNECHRLYGVMNKRLADRPFLAGTYSIADIACVGWASRHERQGQDFAEFPHLKRWLETVMARPAVKKGMSLRVEAASKVDMRIRPCRRCCSASARADEKGEPSGSAVVSPL